MNQQNEVPQETGSESEDDPRVESLSDLAAEAGAEGQPQGGKLSPDRVPSADILREILRDDGARAMLNPPLTDAEAERLASSAGAVIDKYFPDAGVLGFLDKWKEEIALVACVWMIVKSRKRAPQVEQEEPAGPVKVA